MKLAKLLVFLILLITLKTNAQHAKPFFDPRDGKLYGEIEIGSQIWLQHNLDYADTISRLYVPNTRGREYETKPGYNTSYIYQYNDDTTLIGFGKLYTWQAAQHACPVGWHLPSVQEFEELLKTVCGGDLKKAYNALILNGTSEFMAVLAGNLEHGSTTSLTTMPYYAGFGESAEFWTSTEINKYKGKALFVGNHTLINVFSKDAACSVRCIKDSTE